MKYRKNYLNSTESMQIMFLTALNNNLHEIINEWGKRKILTNDAITKLSEAKISINEVIQTVFDNLDQKELKKISNKIDNNTICIYDIHQLNQLEKRRIEAESKVYMDYDTFCDFAEEIMDVRCNGCKTSWRECKLYNVLNAHNAPESQFDLCNCKYSYKL